MRLRTRLTISYGGVTFLALTLTSLLMFFSTKYVLTQMVKEQISMSTQQVGYSVDNYIYETEDIACLIFSNEDAYKYIPEKYRGDDYERLEQEKRIVSFLNSISIFKNYSDFAIVYQDTILGNISSTTESIYETMNLYKTLDEKLQDENQTWFCGDGGNYKRMYFAKRLNDGAIILTSFFAREFDEMFAAVSTDTDMSVVVSNEQNMILYDTKGNSAGSPVEETLATKITSTRETAFSNEDSMVSYYRCRNNWLLITTFPNETIMGFMGYIEVIFIVITVVFLILAVLLGSLFSGSVVKPIKRMLVAMKKVERGEFNNKIPRDNCVELNELSNGINAMVDSVKANIDEVERANKEKSRFLANTSHEIRTPMNAILGYSEMIIEDSKEETTKANANTIRNAAKNLLAIVNDILDISKIEAGKIELKEDNFRIHNVINEVESIIRIPAVQKKLEFTVELLNDFPEELYGDDIKLRQILINLSSNAMKYTDSGYVRITGRCAHVKNDESKIKMIFRVSDSGIGIKPEDIGKVFGAYEQVDAKVNRKKEGTGLGLSIAKEFAKMMGGDIVVESEYGRGTVFTVEVVMKVVNWRAVEEKPLNVEGKKILVVDDTKTNLVLFTRMLEEYHVDIHTAENGQAVLDDPNLPDYDLIFMDHLMPGLNGDDVTRMIRARKDENPKYESIPIIGYTADTDGDVIKILIGAGMNECVVKPINKTKLERVLRRFLAIVLCIGLLFPLGGCGMTKSYAEAQQKVVIEFSWWGNDEHHEYTLDMIQEFEKKYPYIHVKPKYSEYASYTSRTNAMFNAGTEADLMQIGYDWINTYSNDGKGFYDLEKLQENTLNLDVFPESALEYGRSNGTLNAIPVTIDMMMIYYNANFFYNRSLRIPKTWTELDKVGISLKETPYYPITCNNGEDIFYLLTAYAEQKTGKAIYSPGGTLKFGRNEWRIMLEKYQNLVKNHCINPLGIKATNSWENGNAGGCIAWLTEGYELENDLPEGTTIIPAIMPKNDEAHSDGCYSKPSIMYAISDTSEHPEEAALLMNFLLTNDASMQQLGTEIGVPIREPAIQVIVNDEEKDSLQYKAAMMLYEDRPAMQTSRMNGLANMELFEEVIINLYYGKCTIAEAVDELYYGIQ